MNVTSLPIILNRAGAFAIPADGWIHLAPLGEVSAPMQIVLNGKEEEVQVVQVITPQVVDSIVAKFRDDAKAVNFPGILIDFDHFSHDEGKSSRAAGWIEEVDSRADGLWGKVRYSASGKAAVEGGDFRLFSPVLGFEPRRYTAGERVSPRVLLRGALTNDPRFKGMVPISNRQDEPAAENNKTMDYKSVLISLLGLAAAATDADIQAAAAGMKSETEARKSDLAAAQNRATTAEARANKAEADLIEHDLNASGLEGDARNAAKNLLVKNRTEGLALIVALKPGKGGEGDNGYKVTHNRDTAKAPKGDGGSDANKAAEDAQAAKIANRAREIAATTKVPFTIAFRKAKAEYANA